MPRFQVIREAELYRTPSRDATAWYEIVYALPGTVLYVDPGTPRGGALLPVSTTGGGNFQMNTIDAADYLQKPANLTAAQRKQGASLTIPGFIRMDSTRRNVNIKADTAYWVDPSALQEIKTKAPSALLGVGIGVGVVGVSSLLTSLASRK